MIISPSVRWGCHFRPIPRGSTNIVNITRNYNTCCGGGYGGGMSLLGGFLMFLPMMYMGVKSLISNIRDRRNPQVQQQQLVQPQAQQEQPQVDKDLEKLKTLFKDIPWVAEGNGKYTGVKDGKSYRGTYEEILTQLANPGQAREREEITTIKEQAVTELDGPKPGTEEHPIDPNNPIDKTVDENGQLTVNNTRGGGFNPEKAIKAAGLPDGDIMYDDKSKTITYTNKEGATVTVDATKDNIKTAIADRKEANAAFAGKSWTSQEDGALSGDAQFVTADGRVFEILGKTNGATRTDHLNLSRFEVKNGESVKLQDGYTAIQIREIDNTKFANNNSIIEVNGAKQLFNLVNNSDGIMSVILKDQNGKEVKIPLEKFLSGKYIAQPQQKAEA